MNTPEDKNRKRAARRQLAAYEKRLQQERQEKAAKFSQSLKRSSKNPEARSKGGRSAWEVYDRKRPSL